jgi:hypothetical protein
MSHIPEKSGNAKRGDMKDFGCLAYVLSLIRQYRVCIGETHVIRTNKGKRGDF